MALSRRHFAATLRGATSRRASRQAARATQRPTISPRSSPAGSAGLAGHDDSAARPARRGLAGRARRADRAALEPGLYLFIPLILLQTLGTALVEVGFLDTPLLVTPGTFAVRTMGTLTTCLCLLLLFYTVESLERERSTRLAAIAFATPIRTGSLFLGKGVALVVGGAGDRLGRRAGRGDRALDPAKGRPGASAVPAGLGPVAGADGPGLDRRS